MLHLQRLGWSRECRQITTPQSHLLPTWFSAVHILVVAVLELEATDTTLADLLSHLKRLCIITALNHTTLPGKIT